MSEKSIQISVVDNDASVRGGLVRLLSSAGYRVDGYASAEAFLTTLSDNTADCYLLDIRLGGMDGMDLHQHLKEMGNKVPVVFLTGHGDIRMSVSAMKRGAEDFLTKPVDEEWLIAAVEKALATSLKLRSRAHDQAMIDERLARLTPREMEVMRCLLTGAINKQVASHLGIVEKTVKVHRARVFEKMEVHSLAEIARICDHAGLDPIPC